MTASRPGRFGGSEDDETREQLNLSAATTRFLSCANRLIEGHPEDRDALEELIDRHLADLGVTLPGTTHHHADPGADHQASGPLERTDHP